ncbi:MAG: response regulator [Pyrinomonadaceae bacterium]|nr:response regulator [Pyrinomonadaceae bacterium]
MNNRILCVDDEPNILSAYKRTLRNKFDISIASGAIEALSLIAEEGPFAVVVSDMRMPVMDGIQLLGRVKGIAPESVRIMLTGNADIKTAIDAVNQGNIFRFLTKPCQPDVFERTLSAAVEQYRLVRAEKQLLEHTLNNSLQVLVDMLSITNQTAFAHSSRIKKLARKVAEHLQIENPWEVEIAAMLSQIGCISVPEEILKKIIDGKSVTEAELNLYYRHPQVGRDLITRIPRMETIAEIVANQNRRFNDRIEVKSLSVESERVKIGSRILKVVFDYDRLINSGNIPGNVFSELESRDGWYDAGVLKAFRQIIGDRVEEFVTSEISVLTLEPGMTLAEPLVSREGTLLLASGQEVTLSLITRLVNLASTKVIADKIRVNILVNN